MDKAWLLVQENEERREKEEEKKENEKALKALSPALETLPNENNKGELDALLEDIIKPDENEGDDVCQCCGNPDPKGEMYKMRYPLMIDAV